MLKVHSIETFGTHEGPGIRLVVFLQGCNMRCLYCHNLDTQSLQDGKEMSSEEVIELLHKEKPYFNNGGGLTVSGGEPTLQADGLIDLFTKAKADGFDTALDTNGSIASVKVKKLYDLTDLVLLDVKHIDPAWHHRVTGLNNDHTLNMAAYRESTGKPMWLRYVLVPGYTDQEEFIEAWAKYFKDFKTIERVEILPYHTFGLYKYEKLGQNNPLEGVNPPDQRSVQKAQSILVRYFDRVIVQ